MSGIRHKVVGDGRSIAVTVSMCGCDHWPMNAFRIVFPLALAALVAGVIIALAGYESSNVTCGSAFDTDFWPDKGQIPAEQWLKNQETCALIRANKMPWATTLIAAGIAMSVSSYLIRTGAKERRQKI
jgi:hypothetical protein